MVSVMKYWLWADRERIRRMVNDMDRVIINELSYIAVFTNVMKPIETDNRPLPKASPNTYLPITSYAQFIPSENPKKLSGIELYLFK